MTEVVPIKDITGYLRPEQVDSLMAAAKNPRDRLLVRIPWVTGMRVTELISLETSHINYDNRTVRILKQKMRKKDGKVVKTQRIIPIDSITLNMIKEYLEWRKQFSYRGRLLFPITRKRVNEIYWTLAQRAHINQVGDPEISKHLKVHPHLLRHSFAIQCIKHGMPIERLSKILGHQSITTTMVYLQFSAPDLHEEYDTIWERNGKESNKVEAGQTSIGISTT